MKKLMILAAVAAVSVGAFAANCTPTPTTTESAWVYNWKFTGKTTIGAASTTTVSGSTCTPGSSSTACVRVPGSLALQGYTYYCNPTCAKFTSQKTYLWTSTKPVKSGVTPTITFNVANVIGKTKKQYEAEGTLNAVLTGLSNETFDLTFAGLGTYDTKAGRVTSVSGNFAGTVNKTYYVANSKCCATVVWDCATLAAVANVKSVAYGTWSVKYNATASKKFAANGTLPTK